MTDYLVPVLSIGMGYSSLTQTGTSTYCLNRGNIVGRGQPVSQIQFISSFDSTALQKEMGVDLSASATIDTFSGELKGNYAKSSQDNGYSISYSFSYKVILPRQIIEIGAFGTDFLNQFGKNALDRGLDEFVKVCGDKVVVQEELGISLITTLKMNFNSKSDKSNFSGSVSGNIADLGSVMGAIKKSASSESMSGSVELMAIQQGGQVMRLSRILGTSFDNNVLKCSLGPPSNDTQADSISRCQETLNDIMNYAKNDFANQISYNENGTVVGVPTSLGYVFATYTSLSVGVITNPVPQEVTDVRNFLYAENQALTYLNAFLQTLLYSGKIMITVKPSVTYRDPFQNANWSAVTVWDPANIDVVQKAELVASKNSAVQILSAINSKSTGALQCFLHPENCAQINSTIISAKEQNPISFDSVSFFNSSIVLNALCENDGRSVNYGRSILPIGRDDDIGYYAENTLFTFPSVAGGPPENITIQNVYKIKIKTDAKGSQSATLDISSSINPKHTNGKPDICVPETLQSNPPNEAIAVFEYVLTQSSSSICAEIICPVGKASEIFFYQDGPL